MSDADQREEGLFEAALKLPADERKSFLDNTCSGNAELRHRVEVLLRAFERAGPFLKEPVSPGAGRTVVILPREKPGDRIGRYKLLEQIGEGGCGVVYVAEQEEPVRRRVALKVIKLGMDTKQVIARFDAERQALALMDHPNIARVFDAGATETGRPYFVMELVRGRKITDYCEEHQLTPRERFDLFIQVCRAIQHAHQKGIIHRDIKPSNILVTLHDGVPVPKVIDFGIAKATQGRLTDQTVYTAFEQFLGTPAYMSPEQAEMSGLDIDTRSDIYSLGVLLYELLTGTTPFDAKELLSSGLDEMRRTIREIEPVKPSTRLTQAAKLSEKSAIRNLPSAIPSDLDWIVMKCLEKDRKRRYETANSLAADVERHLSNEPIIARPPSRFYRFQKTIQRNKLIFAAGTAIIAALLVGLLGASWQAIRATRAEQEQKRLRETAEKQTEFIKGILKAALPNMATGSNASVNLAILDQLQNAPETEAELRFALADAYSDIGRYDDAFVMRSRADSLRQSLAVGLASASQQATTLTIYSVATCLSAGVAALAVLAFRRKLRLFAFVCVPAGLWLVGTAIEMMISESPLWLLGWSLFAAALGAAGMILLLPRKRIGEPKRGHFPVNLWLDALAGLVFLVVLFLLFYKFENWRGARAWETAKRELEHDGAALDWNKYIPAQVPDARNFFKAPKMAEWFGSRTNDLVASLPRGLGRIRIGELRVLETDANLNSETADLNFRFDSATRSLTEISSDGSIAQVSADLSKRLPQLCGFDEMLPASAGGFVLQKSPVPIKIAVHCESAPTAGELSSAFARIVPWSCSVKANGPRSFELALPAEIAADYLRRSEQSAAQFDLIREAARRPYARMDGDYSDPVNMPAHNFVAMRAVSQTLATRVACRLLLNEPSQALEDLTLIHNLRRTLEARPAGKPMLLVGVMINSAIASLYQSRVEEGFRLGVWKEPQLIALQQQLQDINLIAPLEAACRAEQAGCVSFDPVGLLLKDNTNLWQRLRDPEFWVFSVAPRGWLNQNRVVAARIAQLPCKIWQSITLSNEVISPGRFQNLDVQMQTATSRRSPFHMIAKIAIPNWTKATVVTTRHQTFLNEAQITCALERYRLARGEYPQTLDVLAPEFIERIPRDLVGGRPLHYRRTANGKFSLYSVGWNEMDDGGIANVDRTKGDWVWEN